MKQKSGFLNEDGKQKTEDKENRFLRCNPGKIIKILNHKP